MMNVQLLPCSLLQLHVCDPVLGHKFIKDQNTNHHVHLANTNTYNSTQWGQKQYKGFFFAYIPAPWMWLVYFSVCVCLFTNTTAAAGPTNEYRSPPSRDSQQLPDKKKHFRKKKLCRVERDYENIEKERRRKGRSGLTSWPCRIPWPWWSRQKQPRRAQADPSPGTGNVCGWCGCAGDQSQPYTTARPQSEPSRRTKERRNGERLPPGCTWPERGRKTSRG